MATFWEGFPRKSGDGRAHPWHGFRHMHPILRYRLTLLIGMTIMGGFTRSEEKNLRGPLSSEGEAGPGASAHPGQKIWTSRVGKTRKPG